MYFCIFLLAVYLFEFLELLTFSCLLSTFILEWFPARSRMEQFCSCWCCNDAGLGDASWVAQTSVICQNPKVTAINTAIEVDLTGQVCADSMGTRMYTGIQNVLSKNSC